MREHPVVSAKQPLTDRQLTVLQWLGAGSPPGRWEDGDFRYKTTCYALAARGLADVDRRPASWSATITDAGHYYLQHGRYPGSTLQELREREAAGRAAGRYGEVSAAEYAAAIMQEVEAAGGGQWEFSHDGFHFNSHDVETAAIRSPWRPTGKKLSITSSGNWQDRRYVARFEHDPAADVARTEVTVPARVPRLHAIAIAYRDDPDRHEVSRPSLARACRIVHAIAVEAERRGHALTYSVKPGRGYSEYRSSLSNGQFSVEVGGHHFALRLSEISGGGGAPMDHVQARSKPRWHSTRNTMFVQTGRLSIAITGWTSRSGRKEKFNDGKRTSLDAQLGDLFWELEVRAIELDLAGQERARAAEVRAKQRERAITAAKVRMVEADRVAQLEARAREWMERERLQNYLLAVAERLHRDDEPDPSAVEWLAWMQEHLATTDPLREAPTMPTPPETTEENMRPHLQGWSLREG